MNPFYVLNRRVTKRILLVLVVLVYVSGLFAQSKEEHFFNWDNKALLQKIKAAPMDQNYTAQRAKTSNARPTNQRPNPEDISPVRIDLPMYDGSTQTFNVIESPVLENTDDPNWISVKTYQGHSDDLKTTVRISVSSFGVTIFMSTPQGMRTIQPVNVSANQYKISNAVPHEFKCGTEAVQGLVSAVTSSCNSYSGQLRAYRFAMAATGEYTTFRGGTAQVQSDITNLINYLNLLYEGEMSLHFNLAVNNSAIIYTDPNTDPFATVLGNADPSVGQAGFNSTAFKNVMPEANYDIGHVLHYNASNAGSALDGRAGLGVVCQSGMKASGWSQIDLGSIFDIASYGGIILHEVGHQLGANHPFFSTSGSCNNARVLTSAYEPGSGTTVMSYNGSCAPDNVGSGRSLYFHITNLNEIAAYINGAGSSCSSPVSTGNTPPAVNANPNNLTLNIPSRTPFELKGSATDAEGNPLTYCWEEFDTDPSSGGASPNHAATTSLEPLFRSFQPNSSSTRIVPQPSDILANTQSQGEILPQVARKMKFRLTVRDKFTASGLLLGSWSCDEIMINVIDVGNQGFEVTSQNSATTWTTSSAQTITWNVARTTGTPFNCANVNILFSLDGGNTFPIVLAANAPNNGTATINVPSNIAGITTGRIKVESNCNGNLKYFDINNSDITIKSLSCNAVKSTICNSATVSANAGDPATNLSSPLINYGVPTTTVTLTTIGAVSSSFNGTPAASGAGTCMSFNAGNKGYATFPFRVNKAGSYSFSKNVRGFKIISIYQSSTFNADLPCGNNYLGSNAYEISPGTQGVDFSVTLNLNACTDYILVLYDNNGNTTSLYFTNSVGGTVYSINPPTAPNYNYTYVAVNTGTGIIAAVNSTADFRSLPGGNYCVYGLHYYSGASNPPSTVTPSSFVGQNFNSVQVTDNCMTFSSNYIPLIIKSVCTAPTLVAGTATNPITCGGTNGTIQFTTTNLPNGNYSLAYSVGGAATTKTIMVASGAFTLSGLTAGIYSAFSITNNGCTGLASTSKTLNDPTVPAPIIIVTQPICGIPTGTIAVSSPLSDVTYSFDGGITYQIGNSKSGLIPGFYSVFVKSISNGSCISASTLAVINAAFTVPATPIITITQPTYTTAGTITVNSPSTGVVYSFDGGKTYQIGNSKSGLPPNDYFVVVKSTNTGNCVSSQVKASVVAPNVAPPTFSALPASSIINCPATPNFGNAPIAKDFYNTVLPTTFSDKKTLGSCAGNYSVTRTYTATDAGGKTATTSLTITVRDITPPVIAPLPLESTVDCPISPVFAQAVATDECGTVTLTYKDVTTFNNNPNPTNYSSTVTRQWTAVDGCANSSTATQIIHVRDMPLPTIRNDGNLLIASEGAKYQWYFGPSAIPEATSQTYFSQTSGLYKVLVTNSLGCMRFSNYVQGDTYFQNDCSLIHKNFGANCDDGNRKTVNDRIRLDCICRGDSISYAITVKCPDDITVVSTDTYGTVVKWDEAGMFSSGIGFCYSTQLIVKRTSGYHSGYPFAPSTKIFEQYIATDECGNKSSCSFFVTTTSVAPTSTFKVSNNGININAVAVNEFALYQNIPNPAENSTLIGFNLPGEQSARLTIFNIAGQVMLVKNINGTSGYNEISITTSELNSSGVFYYRLDARDNSATKKMVIMY